MLAFTAAVIVGFAVLVWSADKFIFGAAALARNLGVSTMVIGLTIVGFGTSAPELMVSTFAALQGNPGIAVGNAIGSNIANIALILGVTALIAPLAVQSRTLKRELPLLLAVMLFGGWLLWDDFLGRLDGILMLGLLGAITVWLVYDGLHAKPGDPLQSELEEELPEHVPMSKSLFWLVVGLALLLGSSQILVWGAAGIASALGISDLVIGLTVVAIGTSMPELAASVVSARRGEPDLALGNVIGSNMFNLLGVLGLPGLLAPSVLPPEVMGRDYPFMLVLTVAMVVMAFGFGQPGRINRIEGSLLLAAFVGYIGWLVYSVT
ncbi:MAG: calcium/sodium antiporter [Ectothiorhodospiraceae bacterium]|jgi:cation:H+ antiporter|nr:calcium/sodium antiporter [Ectothiorhodospiraceae bacterium]